MIDLKSLTKNDLVALRAKINGMLSKGCPRPKSVGNSRSNGRPKGSKNRVYPELNSDGQTVDEVLK